MTAEVPGNLGFAAPQADKARSKRRAAVLELMATVGLMVSLVVAATAVTMENRLAARSALRERAPIQIPETVPFQPETW